MQDPQSSNDWKFEDRIIYTPAAQAQFDSGKVDVEKTKASAVQSLSISNVSDNTVILTTVLEAKLAAARSNGTLSAFSVNTEDSELGLLTEWEDTRFKPGHAFIGLDLNPKGLFWCTSSGALGFASTDSASQNSSIFTSSYRKVSLPMRLCAWRLSSDGASFAYGGNEVDLSVWDTERAFQSERNLSSNPAEPNAKSAESKKRKRDNDLLPGEIWRAKNLPNDAFSLRQPIHITSLAFLSSPSSNGSTNSAHLATGTQSGDVRRYDTRAARKPVSNWTGIGKVNGVSAVQAGPSEHELFVADNGTNLSALDLRNGRVIYSYKKLQGAVTSFASSAGGFLGSTSRDRFFRLHSTSPPPATAGQQQDGRGDVLGSLYMRSVPTAIVADLSACKSAHLSKGAWGQPGGDENEDMDENGEDVWAEMQDAGESEGEEKETRYKRRS
ncbi:hypothetical protein DFH11DRAFT_1541795 [Phellopilus nigrolimitatus]|nr:hypothetical protein DFH11DRAFT_1541795 [Phellopilus nigrolimitatus]